MLSCYGPPWPAGSLCCRDRSRAVPGSPSLTAPFEDDEALDNSLREQVAEALGTKYVEELDI